MMKSRVLPGATPTPFLPPSSLTSDTRKRSEQNDVTAGSDGRGMQPPGKYFKMGRTEKDNVIEFVCPSAFPYLLTLRGHDVHKDQLLYPLKSTCLTIGRNFPRSHSTNINLLADDIQHTHCRLQRKTLPRDDDTSRPPADGQHYCYCLQVEVLDGAVVFVNGFRVETSATVHPGDVLAVGHQYLFLYKDPTRGYDIPDSLPWYSGSSYLYAQVNKSGVRNGGRDRQGGEQHDKRATSEENKDHEYSELDYPEKKDGPEDAELTVPYPRDREQEVLDYITSISCPSPSHFPLTTTLLLLGCHGHASRHFPPSHQAGFFRRLLAAVRNRVSMVSKTLSLHKYQTKLYTPAEDRSAQEVQVSTDPLLELLCWLSNCVRIFSHVTSTHFRSCLKAQHCGSDVTESLQALCEGLGETITFMFQQTVYCITKVLYGAVLEILHPETPSSPQTDQARASSAMERMLHVLRVTLDVSEDLSLHRDVTIQLLMYLIFFVTANLFNKLITKGGESHQLSWSTGVRLQSCVSLLENWVSSVGLEAQYLRVSEPLVSLVDLLATSRHSLLRMDWSALRGQYRTLTEGQLARVLSDYHFTDGHTPPPSWRVPHDCSPAEGDHQSDLPPSLRPPPARGVGGSETSPPPSTPHPPSPSHHPLPAGHDGQQHSPQAPHPPSDLPLPTPSHHGTFFSSLSSPSSTLPRDLPHHHNKPLPSQRSQQETHNPPLPHRQDTDSPPPLPPRRPSRTSASQSCSSQSQEIAAFDHGVDSVSNHSGPSAHRYGGDSRELGVPGVASNPGANPLVSDKNLRSERTGREGHSQDGGIQAGARIQTGDVLQNVRIPVQEAAVTPIHVPQNARMPGVCNVRSDFTHDIHGNSPYPEADPPSPQTARISISQKLFQSGLAPHPSTSMHSSQNHHPTPQSQDSFKMYPELKARDPRRRPINGTMLSSGALVLQDKRLVTQVSVSEIPSETTSLASDSAVSDDVFAHSSTSEVFKGTGHPGSSVQAAEFRRFSTGMVSQAAGDREAEERPRVVRVEMRPGADKDHLMVDRFPEDIYIDVAKETGRSGTCDSGLKVLPPGDQDVVSKTLVNGVSSRANSQQSSQETPRVQYRHTMPQDRDLSSKGEITGEVFTLTLLKEGARLGMGLVDGMHTALQLPGIYVRNVLAGTPAALCGHIRVGDRILAVNGRSIIGADYNTAMKLIRSTGPRLNLLVAKCDCSVTARISAS